MSSWAASKFTPGKFLGSTGANILSAKQLASGGNQAWAKRVSWYIEKGMEIMTFQGKKTMNSLDYPAIWDYL